MVEIADMIADVIERGEEAVDDVSRRALNLTTKYTLYA